MGFFSVFAVSFGCMMLLVALMTAWLFRTSRASFLAKIFLPAAIVALACATPFQVSRMMGFPASWQFNLLPRTAELIAFVPKDDVGAVYLWLREGDNPPRAYETILDPTLRKTLNDARERLAGGGRVGLKRGEAKRSQGYISIDVGAGSYEIDESMFALPQKE